MAITIQEVEHLASLARIDLNKDEKVRYTEEISSILDYVQKLTDVKTTQDIDMTLSEDLKSNLRTDVVYGISSSKQSELIKQAPSSQDNLIKTKAVFE